MQHSFKLTQYGTINQMIVEFFASFLIWFLFAGLGMLWMIDGKIKKEQVIHALMSCLFAWAVVVTIKYFFPTLRPFVVNGGDVGVVVPPFDGAFPSWHTATAFALSVSVFMHDRKIGWWFLLSAVIIGISRVLANVHYPIDIVGGALIGTLVAVVVEKTHFFKVLDI